MFEVINIEKHGGSQFQFADDYHNLVNRISADLIIAEKKWILVLSAPPGVTRELKDIVEDYPKKRQVNTIIGKFRGRLYRFMKGSFENILMKDAQLEEEFFIEWDEIFDAYENRVRIMDSKDQICWRKGILTLGEMANLHVIKFLFKRAGVEVFTATDEDYIFRHIEVTPKRGKIQPKTFENILNWDFLKKKSGVALVPGFTGLWVHENQEGLTNLGMEGSDLTPLPYYKALYEEKITHNRLVTLDYFKGISFKDFSGGVGNLKPETLFYGKSLMGQQFTDFVKSHGSPGWDIGVCTSGPPPSSPCRLYFLTISHLIKNKAEETV